MEYGFKAYKTLIKNHEFWVVESTNLKGCVAQADTLKEALAIFAKNEVAWINTALEIGIAIPKTQSNNEVRNENTNYKNIRVLKKRSSKSV